MDIPDEDVPLANLPSRRSSLVDIFDEDVPLANVPKTGDISDAWYLIAVLSAAGLLCLTALEHKKRKNA
nr:doubled motif LPXTG anchor domain-containing protein [Parablautia muri]